MNRELSTHRWFAVRASRPSLATNVNAIGIGIVQIGGALKTEIRARNIDWVRGFI